MAGPRGKGAAGAKREGKKAAEAVQTEEAAAPAPDVVQLQDAPPKKKRNNNPGIRVQGGRVYDSQNGTTCHQCRQKTAETKAKCSACTLYFCPKCLENRYQEQVEEVNARAGWTCPRCRGDCNCSNCRKKAGKEATGQLAAIAKRAGFGSVKGLLEKNPHAKALQLPRALSTASMAAAGGSSCFGASAAEGGTAEPAQRKRLPAKRKVAEAAAAEAELVADHELPPRQQAMPAAQPLVACKSAPGVAVQSKRPRGGLAWMADVPEGTALPEGRVGAELVAVLEFLQVFGSRLQLRTPSLAALAAELLQPAREGGDGAQQLLCPSPDDSLVAAVHCRLLDVVRAYWNVRGAMTAASWQGTMRGYYAATQLMQHQALDLRWQHGPPAVAGELFTRPMQRAEVEEVAAAAMGADDGGEELGEAEEQQEAAVGRDGAAPVAVVEYPAGGYWGVPPTARVAMLHALVHDVLECEELRKCIEDSMGDALDEEKERKQQLAGVRKEAREAIVRERDQQIARMIASANCAGLTLEQQQQMLEEAEQRAEAAASQAAAAKVKALTEKVHPATVRAAVVGSDRDGRRYLQLQVAPLFTGEGGVVVQTGGAEGSCDGAFCSSADEVLGCYPATSLAGVAAALHPQGRCEGPLQAGLVRAFKLPVPAAPPRIGQVGANGGACDSSSIARREQREETEEGSVEAGAASEAAGVPAVGKLKAAAQRRRSTLAPAAEPAPAVAAEDATEPVKHGWKQADGRGKSSTSAAAAASQPVAEAAAANGKRHRQSDEAGGSASHGPSIKRAKGSAGLAAADGKQASGRRTSLRNGGKPGTGPVAKAASSKASARTRAHKTAEQQLPQKVDDMLGA